MKIKTVQYVCVYQILHFINRLYDLSVVRRPEERTGGEGKSDIRKSTEKTRKVDITTNYPNITTN